MSLPYGPRLDTVRRVKTPIPDLLAAVPSIVYGLWGLIAFAPVFKPVQSFIEDKLGWFPLFAPTGISGGTICFIGVVLAIMVLPIVTALSREVFDQTPTAHKEGALALGHSVSVASKRKSRALSVSILLPAPEPACQHRLQDCRIAFVEEKHLHLHFALSIEEQCRSRR